MDNRVVPDIWNPSRNVSQDKPVDSGEFGLAAAVDFLRYSQHPPHPVGTVGSNQGLNNIAPQRPPPLPVGLAPHVGSAAPPPPPPPAVDQSRMFAAPLAKDDSNIVDSLFGPTEPSRSEAGLITGLDGLAIGPPTEMSSIWANGGAAVDEANDILHLGGLLSNPQPSTAGLDEPDRSRFTWGSSG